MITSSKPLQPRVCGFRKQNNSTGYSGKGFIELLSAHLLFSMELRSGKGFVHDIDEIIGEYGVGKMEIDLRKDLVSRNVCSDLVAIAIMLQNVT